MQEELTASGPMGPLAGTLTIPAGDGTIPDGVPVVLIVPGSGPTDRNGNSPLGIAAAPYELLARALAARGYPTVRVDKRGMFRSAGAIPDANDVTIAAYGDDVLSWTQAIRARLPQDTGARCVVPLGHSEGGLVVLAAIARLPDPCGLILVSTPGRPLGDVLRAQLRANPANAPILAEAEAAIASLEKGQTVDTAALSPALHPLFAPQVQGFLIDSFAYDPAVLAAQIKVPMLIVQGTNDIQVSVADARALADAAPGATLALARGVNHVLKHVPDGDMSANIASYATPALPIAAGVVDAVAQFLAGIGDS